jgi:hypothetical protein
VEPSVGRCTATDPRNDPDASKSITDISSQLAHHRAPGMKRPKHGPSIASRSEQASRSGLVPRSHGDEVRRPRSPDRWLLLRLAEADVSTSPDSPPAGRPLHELCERGSRAGPVLVWRPPSGTSIGGSPAARVSPTPLSAFQLTSCPRVYGRLGATPMGTNGGRASLLMSIPTGGSNGVDSRRGERTVHLGGLPARSGPGKHRGRKAPGATR